MLLLRHLICRKAPFQKQAPHDWRSAVAVRPHCWLCIRSALPHRLSKSKVPRHLLCPAIWDNLRPRRRMGKHRILVSLMTSDNDYQQEQAAAAQDAARHFGVDATVIYADNDAITQSQQLLDAVHSHGEKPDAIVCHPVGTALAQVARAAVQKGIGWVVVNREMDYLEELRQMAKAPAFCVNVDQEEVGRIQARQFAA